MTTVTYNYSVLEVGYRESTSVTRHCRRRGVLADSSPLYEATEDRAWLGAYMNILEGGLELRSHFMGFVLAWCLDWWAPDRCLWTQAHAAR